VRQKFLKEYRVPEDQIFRIIQNSINFSAQGQLPPQQQMPEAPSMQYRPGTAHR